jgi:hypothetical protein
MEISFSVIDYIGKIEDGVAVLLSMKVDDLLYELAYWFNKEGGYTLTADKYFLNDFNLVELKDFKGFEQLKYLIDKSLPTKEEIFKEFAI